MEYIIVREYEDRCEHSTITGELSDAIMWARFLMYEPGVWQVWITDFTWGDTYYENGVTVDL